MPQDHNTPHDNNTEEIIASALALSAEQRLEVMGAIHLSLADPLVDHGSEEPAADVQAAWKEEIARRIEDVSSGHIATMPANQAEKMIRSDAPPSV